MRRNLHLFQPDAERVARGGEEAIGRTVVHREVADRDGHLAPLEFVTEISPDMAATRSPALSAPGDNAGFRVGQKLAVDVDCKTLAQVA